MGIRKVKLVRVLGIIIILMLIGLPSTCERFVFTRDYVCFGESRAGEREAFEDIKLNGRVTSAEVLISGFNMWYTREGNDHEVMQMRVDAWVNGALTYLPDEDATIVPLRFMYAMTDEDTGDSDDYNDACIGYTVIGIAG